MNRYYAPALPKLDQTTLLETFEANKCSSKLNFQNLKQNPKFGTLKLHHSYCVFSERCTTLKVLSYVAIL